MVINGSCSTNMCARQLSFNFSSMVWGGGMAPWPPFGSAPAGAGVCAVKRNAQGRRRDKHKKAEQDASQSAVADEPEFQKVDEETLRKEREEAQRRWREEQRKKYPVAPDGMLCVWSSITVRNYETFYRPVRLSKS